MRLAVLGGTFDPIHAGHLFVAREVLRVLGFDQVLLMVAPRPPHKQEGRITGAFHRYAMAVLASQAEDRIVVSGLELERPGPSYTIDTLEQLRSLHPGAAIAFVAGSDSLRELHLWRRYDKLLSEFSLIFVPRYGAEVDLASLPTSANLNRIPVVSEPAGPFPLAPGGSCLLRIQTPDVSSTSIRAALAAGQHLGPELIHPEVLRYIRKHQLYGPSQENP